MNQRGLATARCAGNHHKPAVSIGVQHMQPGDQLSDLPIAAEEHRGVLLGERRKPWIRRPLPAPAWAARTRILQPEHHDVANNDDQQQGDHRWHGDDLHDVREAGVAICVGGEVRRDLEKDRADQQRHLQRQCRPPTQTHELPPLSGR